MWCIKTLNEEDDTDCEVNAIYIGKSYINNCVKKVFDTSQPETWGMEGINDRCRVHKDGLKIQCLIVVAVVTKESILKKYADKGIIKHPEEYTMVLERRLIESFADMKAASERLILLNKSTHPGSTVKEEKAGHVIYMAARTGGKFIKLMCIIIRSY